MESYQFRFLILWILSQQDSEYFAREIVFQVSADVACGHRPEPEVEEAQSETSAWQKLTCVVLLSMATSFHVIVVFSIVKTIFVLVLTRYRYCN